MNCSQKGVSKLYLVQKYFTAAGYFTHQNPTGLTVGAVRVEFLVLQNRLEECRRIGH